MSSISVTVITLNEEEFLKRALESIQDLADEIIIVDSGSTDQTLEIARHYSSKIYTRVFDNFANQKNYAAQKANSEWILSLDGDEVIPNDLSKEIKKAVKEKSLDGYSMPRRNFILGKEIKHSRWSPDRHIWLWRKKSGKWEGEVHEEVVADGLVGELKHAKIHYQTKSIGDFIRTNNTYAALKAKEMYGSGVRFSVLRFFWDPLFEFSVRFVYKKGFLDGWRGLVLSLLMAFYQMEIWIKLLKIQTGK